MTTTTDMIRSAIETVTGQHVETLTMDQKLFDDLGLDSTSVIDLVMQLEDVAHIEIDPNDLTGDVFDTVGSLSAYLERNAAKAE
jgi:acyl carrier protein